MNDADVNLRIEHALLRSDHLRSLARRGPSVSRKHLFRSVPKVPVVLGYARPDVHVKRVVFDVEHDDEVGRWRSAFVKSRSALYERLARQFEVTDDCGCD